MLERLLRFLRGFVVFEIIGNFPERFINLCMRRGLFVFDINREQEHFYAALLLSDYKKIRPFARKSGVRLSQRKRVGVPFLFSRYKARRGLLVGLVLFMIISIFMQNFVWTVEIHGIVTLSESSVVSFLEREGFTAGSFKGTLNTHELERRVMREFPEIGWMSINVIGTKAEIEIKEKAVKPEILDASTPCNIKASHDGLIRSVLTENGNAVVKAGSAVIEGQLLVSSAMVNALNEIDYVHARAEVMADTVRKEVFTVDKTGTYKKPQKPIVRNNLIFCFFEFPISFQSASGEYTSEFRTEKLFLDDTQVEFGVEKEVIVPYENKEYRLTREEGKEILKTEDYLFRLFSLSHTKSIEADLQISEDETSYSLSMVYNCFEDIAKEEVFVVNQ